MTATKTWSVELLIEEEGDRTRADAVLRTPDGESLRGTGRARRNAADPPVPEIGDELACSRALVDLGHRLLDATVADLEAAIGTHVELRA